jgi:hypothetical protein
MRSLLAVRQGSHTRGVTGKSVRIRVGPLVVAFSIGLLSLAGCGQGPASVESVPSPGTPLLLTFEWSPPESGTVDNYLVLVSKNEGPFSIVFERLTRPEYSFYAEDRCSYRIEVQAFNEMGGSPPSDPSEKVAVYQGQVALDSDGDLIPDIWELQHGLNPNDPRDALLDSDMDGLTNLEEYQRGQ